MYAARFCAMHRWASVHLAERVLICRRSHAAVVWAGWHIQSHTPWKFPSSKPSAIYAVGFEHNFVTCLIHSCRLCRSDSKLQYFHTCQFIARCPPPSKLWHTILGTLQTCKSFDLIMLCCHTVLQQASAACWSQIPHGEHTSHFSCRGQL